MARDLLFRSERRDVTEPRRRIETAQPVEEPRRRLVTASDVLNALTLAACAVIAWCLPRAAWKGAARALATLHVRLRGVPAHRIGGVALRLGTTCSNLQRTIVENVYLENIEVLREHHPLPSPVPVRLERGERLAAARSAGRGLIVWVSAFTHADLMTKKALAASGLRAIHLSTAAHGYSSSRLGIRFLNRIRVSAENRYLGGRINVTYGKARAAMTLLAASLARGDVVTITALGAGKRVVTLPFQGGQVHLALGAPQLALDTGAPLIPVFTTPDEHGGYLVHVGETLSPPPNVDATAALDCIVSAYVAQLAPHVEAHAALWRGWTNPGLWTPPEEAADEIVAAPR